MEAPCSSNNNLLTDGFTPDNCIQINVEPASGDDGKSSDVSQRVFAVPSLEISDGSISSGILPPKKGSRKVLLKPGHSLANWIERTKSGEDMTGLGGSSCTRVISMEELKRHNTEKDCWMAIRGKVYNITKYLDYHPGGIPILTDEGGKDATLLFDQNHRWVNIDRLLASCQVGVLKKFSLN